LLQHLSTAGVNYGDGQQPSAKTTFHAAGWSFWSGAGTDFLHKTPISMNASDQYVSEIRNEHSTKEVILQEIKSIPGNLDNVYVFLICTFIQIKFDVRKRQIFKLVTTALIIPLCLEKNQVSSLCICSII